MQRTILCTLFLLVQAVHVYADETDAAIANLPEGPERSSIELGRHIVLDTPRYAPGHVPGGMSCASCHIDGGTRPNASPWYGITGVLPAYSARSGTAVTLEQRINDCFRRSENGVPLALDSMEMKALVAYMSFLSRGIAPRQFGPGRGMGHLASARDPDTAHGQAIYIQKCAACHSASGSGMRSGATYAVPPLWGDASYNIGASMARVGPAAAFIAHNMPLGQGGSLSDQDAIDIASYVNSHPRPDYADKAADWPNGDKPEDARY
ncbi:c-type cytochrome [Paraburkholderia ginsengisoli]|uniref:C-type cytochrome n=1 Tax=Paraburkholderia ginsengisoli TaxID=311231 RepID=A0A7T4T8V9_9BURK|nr:c-type cytochrome [Paraburkholderia ginsengisoli]QQC64307.1 c-type cytochrome [Paraburkholderia ginsengisoli]